jgi:hypothetical protein
VIEEIKKEIEKAIEELLSKLEEFQLWKMKQENT